MKLAYHMLSLMSSLAEASSEGFTATNAGAIGMRETLKILTWHN